MDLRREIYYYDDFIDFPVVGSLENLYVDQGTGIIYTWDGTRYIPSGSGNTSIASQVVLFADLATTEPLKPCAYDNGIAGVGATLIGTSNGQLATVSFTGRIDNIPTALNQIILVRSQVNQRQNGLYLVTQLGDVSNPFILTRIIDADTQDELYPIQVNIFGGATQSNLAYLQKTPSPVIGTSNIVFTTTVIGITNTPVLHVDTVTSAPLPACTYVVGTNPSLPGSGAYLESDFTGTLGTINGVNMVNGRTVLVKDQVNQAHNGTYRVAIQGAASVKWRLVRLDAWGASFILSAREWKVNNHASTKYGARYATNLQSLSNTNVGITNLVFYELQTLPSWLEYDGADLTIWNNGKGNISTNTSYGDRSLRSNTTGNNNTSIGFSSLRLNDAGEYNTGVGADSLYSNTSGSNNVSIGSRSLYLNTTGSDNTAIGSFIDSGNFSGSVLLGRGATATANNQFVVGSSGTNAGAITSEVIIPDTTWLVRINGANYKIPMVLIP